MVELLAELVSENKTYSFYRLSILHVNTLWYDEYEVAYIRRRNSKDAAS